jgi:hypothetical protein
MSFSCVDNKRLDEWVDESRLDLRKIQYPRRDLGAPSNTGGLNTPKKLQVSSGGTVSRPASPGIPAPHVGTLHPHQNINNDKSNNNYNNQDIFQGGYDETRVAADDVDSQVGNNESPLCHGVSVLYISFMGSIQNFFLLH